MRWVANDAHRQSVDGVRRRLARCSEQLPQRAIIYPGSSARLEEETRGKAVR